MRIYMVRHGETNMNERGCYYGRLDALLTDKGKEQARSIGQTLRDLSFDAVYVSPLSRARETARLVLAAGEGTGKAHIHYEELLCEQSFGIFEGLTYKELTQKHPEELAAWNGDFSNYPIPEGESFSDVRARIDTFLQNLKEENYERDANLLIVAHKGTLGHMLASLLGMPLEGYWNFTFEQGCYNQVDLEDGYAIIRRLNQTCR